MDTLTIAMRNHSDTNHTLVDSGDVISFADAITQACTSTSRRGLPHTLLFHIKRESHPFLHAMSPEARTRLQRAPALDRDKLKHVLG